jgi:glycosyltransferase involved in cell wall biosynthesis
MYAEMDTPIGNAQDRDAIQWALFLDDSKFKITAFTSNKPDSRILDRENISLIKLPKLKYLKHLKMTIYLLSPFYSHYLLAKPNLNVLLYLMLKRKLSFIKKKIVIGFMNRLPYDIKYEKVLYSKNYFQFAISKQMQDDYKRITDREIPLISLVYDLSLFYPSTREKEIKKVVCVGTMQMRKNPFLFASIAKRHPDCEFYWIGNGYYFDWIQEKKLKSSITNLHLIKGMKQEELAEFLRGCSIFLFPSIHEGFPNVIVEALASGLPVIAMDTYGPDAVINDYNGFVVENEYEIDNKLHELLKNQNLLSRMSVNARESSKKYSGENSIGELESFLLSI